jgi:hypothetical protein
MDIEDLNFLRDLAEELPRIGSEYIPEAKELENIIYREMEPLFIALGVEA